MDIDAESKKRKRENAPSVNPNHLLLNNPLYFRNIDIEKDVEFRLTEFKKKKYLRIIDNRSENKNKTLRVIHPYTEVRFANVFPFGNFKDGLDLKFKAKGLNSAVASYALYLDPWSPDLPQNDEGKDAEMMSFFEWLDALDFKRLCFLANGHPGMGDAQVKAARNNAVRDLAVKATRNAEMLDRLRSSGAPLKDEEKVLLEIFESIQAEFPQILDVDNYGEFFRNLDLDKRNTLAKVQEKISFDDIVSKLYDFSDTCVHRKEGKPTTKSDGTVRYPKRPVVNVRKQLFKPMFTDLTNRQPIRPDSFPHPWVEKMFDKDFKFRPVILKKANGDTVPFDQCDVGSGDVCAGMVEFETRYEPSQAVSFKIEVQPEVLYFFKKGSFASRQEDTAEDVAEVHRVVQDVEDEYVAPAKPVEETPFDESFIVAKKAKKDEASAAPVEARA